MLYISTHHQGCEIFQATGLLRPWMAQVNIFSPGSNFFKAKWNFALGVPDLYEIIFIWGLSFKEVL